MYIYKVYTYIFSIETFRTAIQPANFWCSGRPGRLLSHHRQWESANRYKMLHSPRMVREKERERVVSISQTEQQNTFRPLHSSDRIYIQKNLAPDTPVCPAHSNRLRDDDYNERGRLRFLHQLHKETFRIFLTPSYLFFHNKKNRVAVCFLTNWRVIRWMNKATRYWYMLECVYRSQYVV